MGSRLGFRADCRWAKNIGWDLAAALKKKQHDAPPGCPACRNTTLAKSENRRCPILAGFTALDHGPLRKNAHEGQQPPPALPLESGPGPRFAHQAASTKTPRRRRLLPPLRAGPHGRAARRPRRDAASIPVAGAARTGRPAAAHGRHRRVQQTHGRGGGACRGRRIGRPAEASAPPRRRRRGPRLRQALLGAG